MGLLDSLVGNVSDEMIINYLKKMKGDNKDLSILLFLNEENELKTQQYAGNMFAHIEALQARNKELHDTLIQAKSEFRKIWEENQELKSEMKKVSEEIQKLKSKKKK